ncbi:MAG: tRNA (adenosine(37)-N6)-threonylcarbamoyltransferase complex ATPase subunit type 1 TsaE [Aquimarina sp.]|nr:tRNA (adenosine(37)-N6)-threonylcarbamoyltransferase complex ATPase subunit type 1 TsaE [Aquimarina sp.]
MELKYSLTDLAQAAKFVIEQSNTKTLLFYGNMGAGKTTLIKEICKQLGVNDRVSSPTFSIVNEYEAENDIIYHFDLYRMEDEEEAYQVGFEEYIDSGHWIFIEWPERLEKLLPQKANKVVINILNQDNRVLEII